MQIFREPALHIFAVCALLFQMANAAMLPLALNALARHEPAPGLVVSASVIIPQAIVALASPWAGTLVQRIGRRPVLLTGFAAEPLRAVLLGLMIWSGPSGLPLAGIQALDGVGGTVFGICLPLLAADTTRRSGYLNFAIGSLGLAAGLGATASTLLAGILAERIGEPLTFFCLAGIGASAWLILLCLMPETMPLSAADKGGTRPASHAT
jgi:MFS family permease